MTGWTAGLVAQIYYSKLKGCDFWIGEGVRVWGGEGGAMCGKEVVRFQFLSVDCAGQRRLPGREQWTWSWPLSKVFSGRCLWNLALFPAIRTSNTVFGKVAVFRWPKGRHVPPVLLIFVHSHVQQSSQRRKTYWFGKTLEGGMRFPLPLPSIPLTHLTSVVCITPSPPSLRLNFKDAAIQLQSLTTVYDSSSGWSTLQPSDVDRVPKTAQ